MMRDFYLWANSYCKISCEQMKYIREIYHDCFNDTCQISAFLEKITTDDRMPPKIKNKIEKYSSFLSNLVDLKHEMNKRNISFITIDDSVYPESLRQIYDPPYVLYYRGDINVISDMHKKIAIVGSRKGTEYGKNATKYFSSSLSKCGFIIVSGMAKNIDYYAHKYCVDSGGRTIAVLGTNIDKIYPLENKALYSEIIESGGLILSEHNFDEATQAYHFAVRNRIISGLCSGVIVVEAEEKSGALITADCALQQDRNVYAVPGSIFSSLSNGCNELIAQGAKSVRKVENILEDYEIFEKKEELFIEKNKLFLKNSGNTNTSCDNILLDDISEEVISIEERTIFDIISSRGAIDIEQISLISGYNISDVTYIVEKLLILDLVVEQGFNRYAPNIL